MEKLHNKGGKRDGAGRKRKAEEIAMLEKMDATLAPIKVWEKLAEKVESGDTNAIKCWLEYRYGKPKQLISVQNEDENGSMPVITWLTTKHESKSDIQGDIQHK